MHFETFMMIMNIWIQLVPFWDCRKDIQTELFNSLTCVLPALRMCGRTFKNLPPLNL